LKFGEGYEELKVVDGTGKYEKVYFRKDIE